MRWKYWSVLVLFMAAAWMVRGAEPVRLRVMTYNIHHGEGNDKVLDMGRIARIMKDSGADLVAVQEVDQKTERVKGLDEREALGKGTGLNAIFGKAMDYQGGEYGQVVLSRWEIKEHKVHQLPQREGREPRILVLAKVGHPAGDLWFGSVHLEHAIEEIRIEQAQALNEIIGKLEGRVIIAGDYNAVPAAKPIQLTLELMADTAPGNAQPTVPAEEPRRRIDYIFVAPKGKWKAISSKVIEEKVASDHRPVWAELEMVE